MMTFLRSNHIKEFTSSYGMHARSPGTLKRSRKLARRLFLSVLTLLPAGGSSQLTQCNVKQQAMPWWRLSCTVSPLVRTRWERFGRSIVFISPFYLLTTLAEWAVCSLTWAFKPIGDIFWVISVQTNILTGSVAHHSRTLSCIFHWRRSIIPVSLAEVAQMVQWLQQEFCLVIICCHQQISLHNRIQTTTVDNNLRNYFFLFWSALLNCNLSHSFFYWNCAFTKCSTQWVTFHLWGEDELKPKGICVYGSTRRSVHCHAMCWTESALTSQSWAKWAQWEQVSGRGPYCEKADEAGGGMVRTNEPPPLGCTTARQPWVFDLCVDDSHHQSLYFEGNGAAANGTLGDWEGGGII